MKKLILSCTFACFSILCKKGIVDAYHNIPTKPQNNNLSLNTPISTNTIPTAPSLENLDNVDAITNTENIVNPISTIVSQPTNIINEVAELPTEASSVENLFNLSTVEQIIPKTNILSVVPLNNNNNILPIPENIANFPNIIPESPVLVVTNSLPVDLSVIENTITGLLNNKTEGLITCYKIITKGDNKTQYIFAPSIMYKNPLKNIYQKITDMVGFLVEKLQKLFCNSQPEATSENLTNALAEYTEHKEQ